MGRPLFILESAANDASLVWPGKVIEYGAQILLRENLEAVIENFLDLRPPMPLRTQVEFALQISH